MSFDGRNRAKERQAGIIPDTALPIAAAGTIYSYDVVFDTPFQDVPSVTVGADSSRPDNLNLGKGSVSTTGFTIYYGRTAASGSTVAYSVSWQATACTQ